MIFLGLFYVVELRGARVYGVNEIFVVLVVVKVEVLTVFF